MIWMKNLSYSTYIVCLNDENDIFYYDESKRNEKWENLEQKIYTVLVRNEYQQLKITFKICIDYNFYVSYNFYFYFEMCP